MKRLAMMALYVAALCCSHVQTISAHDYDSVGPGGIYLSATDRLIYSILKSDWAATYDALDEGADVNALFVPSLWKDIMGGIEKVEGQEFPLIIMAAASKNIFLAQLLLVRGAMVDATSSSFDDQTALQIATVASQRQFALRCWCKSERR